MKSINEFLSGPATNAMIALLVIAVLLAPALYPTPPVTEEPVGLSLGEAYQVADDIRDVVSTVETMGKAPGRDRALHRPSSAAELGLSGAVAHFDRLIARAQNDIPRCEGADTLRELVRAEAERLLPADTVRSAAQAAA